VRQWSGRLSGSTCLSRGCPSLLCVKILVINGRGVQIWPAWKRDVGRPAISPGVAAIGGHVKQLERYGCAWKLPGMAGIVSPVKSPGYGKISLD